MGLVSPRNKAEHTVKSGKGKVTQTARLTWEKPLIMLVLEQWFKTITKEGQGGSSQMS